MAIKFVLFTVLALATVDIVHSQTMDEDTQLIYSYFTEKSLDKLYEIWILFKHKAEERLVKAEEQSLQLHEQNGDLTEAVKDKWNTVPGFAIRVITEVRNTVDEFRATVPTKAPVEWNLLFEFCVKLWNELIMSLATLDPFKFGETLNTILDEIHQYSDDLKDKLDL